jgi:pyruvate formate lyase activating enzyme
MLIGGIQTLSLLDFPKKVATIVFTSGCNFRCGFCHNPQFVDPDQIKKLTNDLIPEKSFFSFLNERRKFLDGVVISGGEPTIQPDLISFIKKIKAMGLEVKLDTNGTNPPIIAKLLENKLIDYIAMDIKSAPQSLKTICRPINIKNNSLLLEKIKESRNLILKADINYEFRTTVLKEFHNEKKIEQIAKFCQGAEKYTIQNFRPKKTLDEKFNKFHGFLPEKLTRFKLIAEKYLKNVIILGD